MGKLSLIPLLSPLARPAYVEDYSLPFGQLPPRPLHNVGMVPRQTGVHKFGCLPPPRFVFTFPKNQPSGETTYPLPLPGSPPS